MPAKAVVRAIIDEQTKRGAAVVLASLGLTMPEAIRIFLDRVAREKGLPFDLDPGSSPLKPSGGGRYSLQDVREALQLSGSSHRTDKDIREGLLMRVRSKHSTR